MALDARDPRDLASLVAPLNSWLLLTAVEDGADTCDRDVSRLADADVILLLVVSLVEKLSASLRLLDDRPALPMLERVRCRCRWRRGRALLPREDPALDTDPLLCADASHARTDADREGVLCVNSSSSDMTPWTQQSSQATLSTTIALQGGAAIVPTPSSGGNLPNFHRPAPPGFLHSDSP